MNSEEYRDIASKRLSSYIDVERFPCTKFELLRHAEEGHAPDDVLDCIEDMDVVVVPNMEALVDCFAAGSERECLTMR